MIKENALKPLVLLHNEQEICNRYVLLLLIIRIKNVLFLVMIITSQRQYHLLLIVNKINNLKDVLFEYT